MNEDLKEKLDRVGIEIPKILLPKNGVDLNKWAVVACDQFTSEPEYWKRVEKYVGDSPSTLKITLPEVYLESFDKNERINKINTTMKEYLDSGILEEKFEGMVLVERELPNKNGEHTSPSRQKRRGLILTLDLEKYEYTKGSKTLIRATEGTVESRIPPRLEIRKNALVELPHIMVLIDDPGKTVIEPAHSFAVKAGRPIYDFELMMGGGQIKGWKITDEKIIENMADSLEKLISADGFLFAMGDGNHSLATAKAHWNNLKQNLSEKEKETHPARFAMVEVVNVHDEGIQFEPIHRVIMKNNQSPMTDEQLEKIKNYIKGSGREIEIVTNKSREKIQIKEMGSNLVVGNLQILLDKYIEENPEIKIDYIHGRVAVEKIVKEKSGVGFLLEGMKKEELFPTVEKDGALPRKTFSMGEAEEKRYYLESRKIVP